MIGGGRGSMRDIFINAEQVYVLKGTNKCLMLDPRSPVGNGLFLSNCLKSSTVDELFESIHGLFPLGMSTANVKDPPGCYGKQRVKQNSMGSIGVGII